MQCTHAKKDFTILMACKQATCINDLLTFNIPHWNIQKPTDITELIEKMTSLSCTGFTPSGCLLKYSSYEVWKILIIFTMHLSHTVQGFSLTDNLNTCEVWNFCTCKCHKTKLHINAQKVTFYNQFQTYRGSHPSACSGTPMHSRNRQSLRCLCSFENYSKGGDRLKSS